MDEILKKLLAEKVFREETIQAVKESFRTQLEAARVEQEKAVRAELVEQYEKDRTAMTMALEAFLENEVKSHVAELQEGVEQVERLKTSLVRKHEGIREAAQQYVGKRIKAIESLIDQTLKSELTELHESERINRRAYMKKIEEAQAQAEKDRATFKKHAAAVLENIVNVKVMGALDELREDIQAARQADFGREIYEAFMVQFRRQFFNRTKEVQELAERLKVARAEAADMKKKTAKVVAEAKRRVAQAEGARAKLVERIERKTKLDRLLAPLTGQTARRMRTLLESTRTEDLEKQFKKFLPEFRKKTPVQKGSGELVLRTGGAEILKERDDDDQEIVEIRSRAGLKV